MVMHFQHVRETALRHKPQPHICHGQACRRQPHGPVRAVAQVMMRLKSVRHLDNRQAALVEGAFYAATAPKGAGGMG